VKSHVFLSKIKVFGNLFAFSEESWLVELILLGEPSEGFDGDALANLLLRLSDLWLNEVVDLRLADDAKGARSFLWGRLQDGRIDFLGGLLD
jgi:hypothetical protein